MGMLDIGKDWGVFQDEKKQDEAKYRKNHRGQPDQSASHQTPGEEFTFQQD
jgi:hypothetical protein